MLILSDNPKLLIYNATAHRSQLCDTRTLSKWPRYEMFGKGTKSWVGYEMFGKVWNVDQVRKVRKGTKCWCILDRGHLEFESYLNLNITKKWLMYYIKGKMSHFLDESKKNRKEVMKISILTILSHEVPRGGISPLR